MNKPYYQKWCIANVAITFPRLKGFVETETNKRTILRGQKFKPLTNELNFKFIGYHEPLFEIIEEGGGQ